MVAVVVDDGFDLGEFQSALAGRLPAYALPVFVRICATLDITETFKQRKQDLIREGFDPRLIREALFFLDGGSAYRLLDAVAYARIVDGSIRL
jgi:fatty-acyl-CoA synthase